MLNYPFMHIFNKSTLIFGIPMTLLYFFVGWPISIFVIYLFSVYLEHATNLESPPAKGQRERSEEQE